MPGRPIPPELHALGIASVATLPPVFGLIHLLLGKLPQGHRQIQAQSQPRQGLRRHRIQHRQLRFLRLGTKKHRHPLIRALIAVLPGHRTAHQHIAHRDSIRASLEHIAHTCLLRQRNGDGLFNPEATHTLNVIAVLLRQHIQIDHLVQLLESLVQVQHNRNPIDARIAQSHHAMTTLVAHHFKRPAFFRQQSGKVDRLGFFSQRSLIQRCPLGIQPGHGRSRRCCPQELLRRHPGQQRFDAMGGIAVAIHPQQLIEPLGAQQTAACWGRWGCSTSGHTHPNVRAGAVKVAVVARGRLDLCRFERNPVIPHLIAIRGATAHHHPIVPLALQPLAKRHWPTGGLNIVLQILVEVVFNGVLDGQKNRINRAMMAKSKSVCRGLCIAGLVVRCVRRRGGKPRPNASKPFRIHHRTRIPRLGVPDGQAGRQLSSLIAVGIFG